MIKHICVAPIQLSQLPGVGVFNVGPDMGFFVGDAVGDDVGLEVGGAVGAFVGMAVGLVVGDTVGDDVGLAVGEAVGDFVGLIVGLDIGSRFWHSPAFVSGTTANTLLTISSSTHMPLPARSWSVPYAISICTTCPDKSATLKALADHWLFLHSPFVDPAHPFSPVTTHPPMGPDPDAAYINPMSGSTGMRTSPSYIPTLALSNQLPSVVSSISKLVLMIMVDSSVRTIFRERTRSHLLFP